MTEAVTNRSNQLFDEQRDRISANTDRLFGILMPIQYIGAVIWASLASPLTWAGGQSAIHPHVLTALILGGVICLPTCVLTFSAPGRTLNRYVVAVAQMLMGSLLIHVSGGRIETHFHVFGSLAFLAIYRDWKILIPATLIVAVDHVVRGVYLPLSVYGVAGGAEWRFLEHAGWVLFEDVVLVASILRSVREMRTLADRQAELEETNVTIESKVEERTRELKESEERFRSFSEQAVDALFLFDQDGHILAVNAQTSRSLGYPREQLLTMGLKDIEADEARVIGSALRGMPDEPVTIEGELRRSDGSVFPVEVRAGVLPLDGQRRILALARDATERMKTQAIQRAKEETEATLKAKTHFLSRMSHEFRTPLNAVLGFAQLLDSKEPSPRQQEYVSYILQAGNHLLSLIDEVLEISRLEIGSMALARERVTIDDVLQEAMNMVMAQAQQRGIIIERKPFEGEPLLVQADRQRLYQVAINILANSVKYNKDGGTVTVSAEVTASGRVRISFVDTGIGISEEMKARVFTPFDRLGIEKKAIADGTGLGLSLSKNLVEAMGGTITFESTVGIGSTFTVELDRAAPEAVPMALGDVAA